MNESYEQELQMEIHFLQSELTYLQGEITTVRNEGDTAEYTKLIRTCLTVQKQYLKLCAEFEKLTSETEVDKLAAFNGA